MRTTQGIARLLLNELLSLLAVAVFAAGNLASGADEVPRGGVIKEIGAGGANLNVELKNTTDKTANDVTVTIFTTNGMAVPKIKLLDDPDRNGDRIDDNNNGHLDNGEDGIGADPPATTVRMMFAGSGMTNCATFELNLELEANTPAGTMVKFVLSKGTDQHYDMVSGASLRGPGEAASIQIPIGTHLANTEVSNLGEIPLGSLVMISPTKNPFVSVVLGPPHTNAQVGIVDNQAVVMLDPPLLPGETVEVNFRLAGPASDDVNTAVILAGEPAGLLADGAPRSLFGPADDPLALGSMKCFRQTYRTLREPRDIWRWIQNITRRPARPVWILICNGSKKTGYTYTHKVLMPGEAFWLCFTVPGDDTGGIQYWVIDPRAIFPPWRWGIGGSSAGVSLPRVADVGGAVQTGHLLGYAVVAEATGLWSSAAGPWLEALVNSPAWKSPPDPRTAESRTVALSPSDFDTQTRSVNNPLPNGFQHQFFTDVDGDGAPDERVTIHYAQAAGGDMDTTMSAANLLPDGTEISSFFMQVHKSEDDAGTMSLSTQFDTNGDGLFDRSEMQTIQTIQIILPQPVIPGGPDIISTTSHDLNNDGLADQSEIMTLHYNGALTAAQTNRQFNALGELTNTHAAVLIDLPGGYTLEQWRDQTRSRTFSYRERHEANLSALGQGTDTVVSRIDRNNDGIVDSVTRFTTQKALDATGFYTETVQSDLDDNGLPNALASRWAYLASDQPPRRPTLGITRDGNTVTVTFPTEAGRQYTLQETDSLSPGHSWTNVASLTGAGGPGAVTRPVQAATSVFARVIADDTTYCLYLIVTIFSEGCEDYRVNEILCFPCPASSECGDVRRLIIGECQVGVRRVSTNCKECKDFFGKGGKKMIWGDQARGIAAPAP